MIFADTITNNDPMAVAIVAVLSAAAYFLRKWASKKPTVNERVLDTLLRAVSEIRDEQRRVREDLPSTCQWGGKVPETYKTLDAERRAEEAERRADQAEADKHRRGRS